MQPELSKLKTSCQEKTFSESVTTNISDVGEFKKLSVRLYRKPASVLFQHFVINM